MTEKERLIEIMQEWGNKNTDSFPFESVADNLLANGVIVPPCKVGDTVYEHQTTLWMDECGECEYFRVGGFGDPHECARTKSPFKHPDCIEIEEVVATQKDIFRWLAYGDFGKTVFLTREEAEKALERSRG